MNCHGEFDGLRGGTAPTGIGSSPSARGHHHHTYDSGGGGVSGSKQRHAGHGSSRPSSRGTVTPSNLSDLNYALRFASSDVGGFTAFTTHGVGVMEEQEEDVGVEVSLFGGGGGGVGGDVVEEPQGGMSLSLSPQAPEPSSSVVGGDVVVVGGGSSASPLSFRGPPTMTVEDRYHSQQQQVVSSGLKKSGGGGGGSPERVFIGGGSELSGHGSSGYGSGNAIAGVNNQPSRSAGTSPQHWVSDDQGPRLQGVIHRPAPRMATSDSGGGSSSSGGGRGERGRNRGSRGGRGGRVGRGGRGGRDGSGGNNNGRAPVGMFRSTRQPPDGGSPYRIPRPPRVDTQLNDGKTRPQLTDESRGSAAERISREREADLDRQVDRDTHSSHHHREGRALPQSDSSNAAISRDENTVTIISHNRKSAGERPPAGGWEFDSQQPQPGPQQKRDHQRGGEQQQQQQQGLQGQQGHRDRGAGGVGVQQNDAAELASRNFVTDPRARKDGRTKFVRSRSAKQMAGSSRGLSPSSPFSSKSSTANQRSPTKARKSARPAQSTKRASSARLRRDAQAAQKELYQTRRDYQMYMQQSPGGQTKKHEHQRRKSASAAHQRARARFTASHSARSRAVQSTLMAAVDNSSSSFSTTAASTAAADSGVENPSPTAPQHHLSNAAQQEELVGEHGPPETTSQYGMSVEIESVGAEMSGIGNIATDPSAAARAAMQRHQAPISSFSQPQLGAPGAQPPKNWGGVNHYDNDEEQPRPPSRQKGAFPFHLLGNAVSDLGIMARTTKATKAKGGSSEQTKPPHLRDPKEAFLVEKSTEQQSTRTHIEETCKAATENPRPPSRHKPPVQSLGLDRGTNGSNRGDGGGSRSGSTSPRLTSSQSMVNVGLNGKHHETGRRRNSNNRQKHDPAKDGFTALDDSAWCPFRIEVTHSTPHEQVRQGAAINASAGIGGGIGATGFIDDIGNINIKSARRPIASGGWETPPLVDDEDIPEDIVDSNTNSKGDSAGLTSGAANDASESGGNDCCPESNAQNSVGAGSGGGVVGGGGASSSPSSGWSWTHREPPLPRKGRHSFTGARTTTNRPKTPGQVHGSPRRGHLSPSRRNDYRDELTELSDDEFEGGTWDDVGVDSIDADDLDEIQGAPTQHGHRFSSALGKEFLDLFA